jgi:8-oxo-dGTP pyrophosphatase MutT (NUDIX family)
MPSAIPSPSRFDPTIVPIERCCDTDPRITANTLVAHALRNRFLQTLEWTPEITDENRYALAADVINTRSANGLTTDAAVLIPVLQKSDGLSILLTQRSDHLHDHAGQISFPGGRMDVGDTDLYATALRESQEEIGLQPERVEVIGTLPEYLTVSGYRVTPVVALVDPQAHYSVDAFEVADVFDVPLAFLMNPANHQVRVWSGEGEQRRFYAMPYQDRFIWGATAGMLRNLYHFLKV